MINLWLVYLGIGYIVAVLFASFFKKIFVIQKTSYKNDEREIKLNIERACCLLELWRFTIIFADPDDEIFIVGFNRVFSLETGVLLLLSWLIWPIFLVILAIIAYGNIFGKSLSTSFTSTNEREDKETLP